MLALAPVAAPSYVFALVTTPSYALTVDMTSAQVLLAAPSKQQQRKRSSTSKPDTSNHKTDLSTQPPAQQLSGQLGGQAVVDHSRGAGTGAGAGSGTGAGVHFKQGLSSSDLLLEQASSASGAWTAMTAGNEHGAAASVGSASMFITPTEVSCQAAQAVSLLVS